MMDIGRKCITRMIEKSETNQENKIPHGTRPKNVIVVDTLKRLLLAADLIVTFHLNESINQSQCHLTRMKNTETFGINKF